MGFLSLATFLDHLNTLRGKLWGHTLLYCLLNQTLQVYRGLNVNIDFISGVALLKQNTLSSNSNFNLDKSNRDKCSPTLGATFHISLYLASWPSLFAVPTNSLWCSLLLFTSLIINNQTSPPCRLQIPSIATKHLMNRCFPPVKHFIQDISSPLKMLWKYYTTQLWCRSSSAFHFSLSQVKSGSSSPGYGIGILVVSICRKKSSPPDHGCTQDVPSICILPFPENQWRKDKSSSPLISHSISSLLCPETSVQHFVHFLSATSGTLLNSSAAL